MKKYLILLMLSSIFYAASSQEKWENILSSHNICCLKYYESKIYAGTVNGGLVIIDRKTEKIKNLNKANSQLPSNTITAIEISKSGVIWLATDKGLVKIENNTWSNIKEIKELTPVYQGQNSLNQITKMVFDKNGNLWMKSYFHLIRYNEKNTVIYPYNSKDFPMYRATDLICDNSGNTWICGFSGILKIDKNDNLSSFNAGISQAHILSAIETDSFGKIYFAYKGDYLSGIGILENGKINLKDFENSMVNVNSLKIDSLNKLWICTYENGLFYLENDTFKKVSYDVPDSFYYYNLNCLNVTSLLFEKDKIWFGSSGGLFSFQDGKTKYYNSSVYGHFNPDINVISKYNGNMLFGTSFGLFALNQSGIRKFDPFSLTAHNGFTFLNTDLNNYLWTDFKYFDGQQWNMYSIKDLTQSYSEIHAFTIDYKNNKWFSISTKYGIKYLYAKYDNKDWYFFEMDKSEFPGIAFMANSTGSGNVYLSNSLTLAVSNGYVWDYFNSDNSKIPSANITCINSDKKTNWVWLGFENINSIVSGDSEGFQIHQLPWNYSKYNVTHCIIFDHDSVLWIGTELGLYKINPLGGWKVFTAENSPLPSSNIKSILIDEDNRKWILSDKGVSVLDDNYDIEEVNTLYAAPNPASKSTKIYFRLDSEQHVTLRVCNLAGSTVIKLIDQNMGAGEHYKTFDCSNLLNGVYLLELTTANKNHSGKLVVINSEK